MLLIRRADEIHYILCSFVEMQRVKKFSLAEPSSATTTEAPKSDSKPWAFGEENSLCFGIYYHLIGRGWWWDKTKDVNVASDMYFWTHARCTCGRTGQCVELKRYPHKWYSFEQSMMAISIRRAALQHHPYKVFEHFACCCLTDQCYAGPMRTACMESLL